MKNYKPPGMDGLTEEFYTTFFENLHDTLREVYVELRYTLTTQYLSQ